MLPASITIAFGGCEPAPDRVHLLANALALAASASTPMLGSRSPSHDRTFGGDHSGPQGTPRRCVGFLRYAKDWHRLEARSPEGRNSVVLSRLAPERLSRAAFILLVLSVAVLVIVSFPPASEAKACGSVQAKGRTWIVGGAGASCDFMRTWSRRYIQRRSRPTGWRCHLRRGSGGCSRRGNSRRFFVFYPPD